MRFFADLHIHSHFSRATSRALTVDNILAWAMKKGLGLVGTGDFTHPGWMKEIAESLEEDGSGFLVPRKETLDEASKGLPESVRGDVRFVLQVEVSSIFKKADRVRKVHTLVYMPDMAAAARFNTALGRLGNVTSDGRPILGLDPLKIFRLARDAHPDAVVVPAHIWTPHFSLFGAKSGFDAIEECFEDMAGEIFALETGLSSDVIMNRRWSALDRFSMISSSDAHSASKLGREATIFDCEPSFKGIMSAMKGFGGLEGTIEFYPEEGKYHLHGHRKCGFSCTPEEARGLNGICPVCGKAMTRGVLGRVDDLADRPDGSGLNGFAPQHCLIPLVEVLGELLGVGPASKRVQAAYERAISEYGPELDLLGWKSLEGLHGADAGLLAEALGRMRSGRVHLDGGFDGEYGHVGLFRPGEVDSLRGQGLMFGLGAKPPKNKPGSQIRSGIKNPRAEPSDAPRVTDDGLSAEQSAAVHAGDAAVLVVAGPGTGKTRTLVARAERLLREGCKPSRILVLTFTNRAADEVRERLIDRERPFDASEASPVPMVVTFHAFALSALAGLAEARGFTPPEVVDSSEALVILSDLLDAGAGPDAKKRAKALLADRSRGLSAGDQDSRWIDALDARMRQRGVVDLDGLVPALVRELESGDELGARIARNYLHVLVDEFQDIGRDQYRLLRLLKPDGKGLFAVGDPDQSIYAFRGSDPRAFDRFQEDWGGTKVLGLTQSHRCPGRVLSLAAAVMKKGAGTGTRVGGSAVSLVSGGREGAPTVLYRARSPMDEAAWVCRRIQGLLGGVQMHDSSSEGSGASLGDIAVLARTHHVLEPVAEVLSGAGIPVERASDRPLWETPWVRVVMEALREGDPDEIPEAVAKRALDEAVLAPSKRDLKALISLVDGMTPEEAAVRLATLREVDAFGLNPERISLLTAHAAKGLEFDFVFVVGCEDGVFPMARRYASGASDLDEERRLLFVAMTRARRELALSFPTARGRGNGRVSRFLRGKAARLVEVIEPKRVRKKPSPVQQGLFDEK
ncbi:MAG: UvrD-helicase domain-containing protein [Deltaproteobacteria bacterium]|nr:UvrD-helicase domain-containing protein [Deltaproteobacteria bacterium]